MAARIDLDTDELRNVVSTARRLNDSLTEAMELLNRVVTHNDWACPERFAINDNTTANRSRINQLQSNSSSFYNNISYALEQFQALEQEINHRFDEVDGPIGQFLSLVPDGSASSSVKQEKGGFAGAVSDVLDSWGSALKGVGGGIKKAVDVVSFQGIADALKND